MTLEGRAPTAPELLRDFEVLLADKLAEERRRRRGADRLSSMALFLAVISIAAAAVMAYSLYARGPTISAGVINASEVRLVDGSGQVRGRWLVLPDGAARLTLLDGRGTERMRLTLLDDGSPGLSLADSRGEGRVVLSLESEGSRLTFADGAGRPRTMLGLAANDAGTLLFADAGGVPRAAMGLEVDGRATFVLTDDPRPPAQGPVAGDTTTISAVVPRASVSRAR